jgi:hypothetical protein
VAFSRVGVGLGCLGWAAVTEEAVEEVGEEVGRQAAFLERVDTAGSNQVGPVLELGLPVLHALQQVGRPHLLAQDFWVEERFGFGCHLPGDKEGGAGKKPSVFLRGLNAEQRTPNAKLRSWRLGGGCYPEMIQ